MQIYARILLLYDSTWYWWANTSWQPVPHTVLSAVCWLTRPTMAAERPLFDPHLLRQCAIIIVTYAVALYCIQHLLHHVVQRALLFFSSPVAIAATAICTLDTLDDQEQYELAVRVLAKLCAVVAVVSPARGAWLRDLLVDVYGPDPDNAGAHINAVQLAAVVIAATERVPDAVARSMSSGTAYVHVEVGDTAGSIPTAVDQECQTTADTIHTHIKQITG